MEYGVFAHKSIVLTGGITTVRGDNDFWKIDFSQEEVESGISVKSNAVQENTIVPNGNI